MKKVRKLNSLDVKIFEDLMHLDEQGTLIYMYDFLCHYDWKNVIINDKYLLFEGDIPVVVIAHADTVYEDNKERLMLLYDQEKGLMGSLSGLGFDDKAGCAMIIKLVANGLQPHILITTGEESCCTGTHKFIEDYPIFPIKNVRYFLQIDRRGENDFVTYMCDNWEFDEYVEEFGFFYAHGSYTDISFLMQRYGIAGCNVSCGYYNEHTMEEFLNVTYWLDTYDKVCEMLKDEPIPYFVFQTVEQSTLGIRCDYCGKEIVPNPNGLHMCPECEELYWGEYQ